MTNTVHLPSIQPMRKEHQKDMAELYMEGIPNAIFCALGKRFLMRLSRYLTGRAEVCAFVGLNEDGKVVITMVGTLD